MLQGCTVGDIIDNIAPDKDKELTAEELYELVSPSVVEIAGKTSLGSSTGTGFFYDNKGTVVTNYHVIEGCTSAEIMLTNGSIYKVDKVLGYDVDRDIVSY
jgi:S1-C subfamily serine protease